MRMVWEGDCLTQQGLDAGGPRAEQAGGCGVQGHTWLQSCVVEKGGRAEGSGDGEVDPEEGGWIC